jgi:Domain of unknown function (DUF4281)
MLLRMDLLFKVINNSVMPAWLLLALAPRWKWTQRIVHSIFIPALLAVAYGALLVTSAPGPEGASFTSLEGVSALFRGQPAMILACWTHYLVFDLFVGAWEARDAQRLGISHWFVVPCLFLTLMYGPMGLLAWMLVRTIARQRVTLVESP